MKRTPSFPSVRKGAECGIHTGSLRKKERYGEMFDIGVVTSPGSFGLSTSLPPRGGVRILEKKKLNPLCGSLAPYLYAQLGSLVRAMR